MKDKKIVKIDKTEDGSTLYSIKKGKLSILIEHWDDGDVSLVVDDGNKSYLYDLVKK